MLTFLTDGSGKCGNSINIQLKISPLTSSSISIYNEKKHQQATQMLGLGEIFLLNFPSGLTVVDFQTPQKPNKFAQLDFKVPVYAMHAQIHKSFVIFYFSPSLHFIMTDDSFPHVKPLIE